MSHQIVSLIKNPTARAERGDETTRRLCAASYHDREFRNTVLHKVFFSTCRRVAPSYGFDLVPVVDHAWRAWCLDAVQQLCVLAVLAITTVYSPATALTAVCALALWWLSGWAGRLAPSVVRAKAGAFLNRLLPGDHTMRTAGDLKKQIRQLKVSSAGCVVLVTIPAFAAGAAQMPFRLAVVRSAVPLLLIALSTAVVVAERHWSIVMVRRAGRLRPRRPNARLRVIDRQQAHTLVVYRRPKPRSRRAPASFADFLGTPDEPAFFAGSGQLVHRWLPPLAIQLLRPCQAEQPDQDGARDITRREHVNPPFTAHELIDHLRRMMRPIGHPADPIRLRGYRISDRVYVEETDVAGVLDELHGPCGTEFLRAVMDDPDHPCQHFLEMRATSSGELVTTVFLRVTVKGRALSLDFATCALTRTPNAFKQRARARPGVRALTRAVLAALGNLPAETARCWQAVFVLPALYAYAVVCALPGSRDRAAQFSIREDRAASWGEAVFDEPAILDQMKIIELRLLQATEDFLRAHDIDTSTFEKRAETIISANVLNMGGRVDINNSAVGPNATANQNGPAQEPASQGAAK